ncbi:hypothetical protein BH20ACI3_BH20ACI3_16570 [soil metagenome]
MLRNWLDNTWGSHLGLNKAGVAVKWLSRRGETQLKMSESEETFNLMPRTEKADAQYRVFSEPDGPDPRGEFRKIDTTAHGKGGRFVESLFYPIINPYTRQEVWPRKGGAGDTIGKRCSVYKKIADSIGV